jgi:hypothetical protein
MIIIIESEVKLNCRGKKVWIIKKNDYDKSVIGEITTTPHIADNLPLGSIYRTVLITNE